jgi:hypothetical protein
MPPKMKKHKGLMMARKGGLTVEIFADPTAKPSDKRS